MNTAEKIHGLELNEEYTAARGASSSISQKPSECFSAPRPSNKGRDIRNYQSKSNRSGRSIARLNSAFTLGNNLGSASELYDGDGTGKKIDKMGQRYQRLMAQNTHWMNELEKMGKNLDILKVREKQIKQYQREKLR